MVTLRFVDFETGDFTQGIQQNTGCTITKGLIGKYAAKMIAPPVKSLGLWSFSQDDFPEQFIDFLLNVEAGFKCPTWNLLWEVNAPYPVGANEHVALIFGKRNGLENALMLQFYSTYPYRNYDLPFEWGLGGNQEGESRVAVLDSGVALPTGKTVHVAIHIVYSYDVGLIRISLNGAPIINYYGRTKFDYPINPDNNQLNPNVAHMICNYCDNALPAHTLIYDNIYIGTEPNPNVVIPPEPPILVSWKFKILEPLPSWNFPQKGTWEFSK